MTDAPEAVATEDAALDSEAIAAAEQAERDAEATEHIAAFGCATADRVFLASVPGRRRKNYSLTIRRCPGCDGEHVVKAMPRERMPADEIAVQVDLADNPDAAAPLRGRQSVSDADIIAAVPAEDKPLSEVAAALGLSDRAALRRRMERMNRRADSPVFVLSRAARRRQWLVRRAESP